MTTNELSIKLLINTKTNKLCFAEAGSDVVEFLMGLLSLPLGTITSLLAKENMAGSVGNLLGSAEKLDASYSSKERHLSPAVAPATLSCLQQLLGSQLSNSSNKNGNLFTCESRINNVDTSRRRRSIYDNEELGTYTSVGTGCGFVSATYGTVCPGCGGYMQKATTLPGAGTKPTYTVKDDLSVTPASLSLITLLAECGVTDLSVTSGDEPLWVTI